MDVCAGSPQFTHASISYMTLFGLGRRELSADDVQRQKEVYLRLVASHQAMVVVYLRHIQYWTASLMGAKS